MAVGRRFGDRLPSMAVFVTNDPLVFSKVDFFCFYSLGGLRFGCRQPDCIAGYNLTPALSGTEREHLLLLPKTRFIDIQNQLN